MLDCTGHVDSLAGTPVDILNDAIHLRNKPFLSLPLLGIV